MRPESGVRCVEREGDRGCFCGWAGARAKVMRMSDAWHSPVAWGKACLLRPRWPAETIRTQPPLFALLLLARRLVWVWEWVFAAAAAAAAADGGADRGSGLWMCA